MKKIALLFVVASTFILPACSVYMAANQPEKKDTAILSEGVPREVVIGEFGAPATTDKQDGIRTDVFTFHKGSHTGWKVGRAAFHTAADVVTLGLWEIVGTPTEVLVKGDRITATVKYDEKDRVKSWRLIGDEAKPQPVSTGGNSDDE